MIDDLFSRATHMCILLGPNVKLVNLNVEYNNKGLENCINIYPIQDGPFRSWSQMGGGAKRPLALLKSLTNILQS